MNRRLGWVGGHTQGPERNQEVTTRGRLRAKFSETERWDLSPFCYIWCTFTGQAWKLTGVICCDFHSKILRSRGLKQQIFFLTVWGQEVQGVSRVIFSWGPCHWLVYDHLPMSPCGLSPVSVYVFISSSCRTSGKLNKAYPHDLILAQLLL